MRKIERNKIITHKGYRSMDWIEEFLGALHTIEIDPDLTEDQLKELVEAQICDLIEMYRIEQLQEADN